MVVVALSFPAGRFHATPWGRQVNEGAVEWPPSPWRLLRALIATWHLKARDEIGEPVLRDLIGALAAAPVEFQLPPATMGHTRHFMPLETGKRTKVFDTFVQTGAEKEVLLRWDASLTPATEQALQILISRLGYLGRAEALVAGRIAAMHESFTANSSPLSEEQPLGDGQEIVRLLVPRRPDAYTLWRAGFVREAQDALGPKPTPAQKKKLPKVPADLYEALLAETGDLQAAGWNLPPGAIFQNYTRRANAFDVTPVRRRVAPVELTVARFAIASAVLPRITQAISVADRVHQSLVKFSGNEKVFTGKELDGTPLLGHAHAHIFCEVSDQRDAITHLTVFAPMGFNATATLALRRLRRVWGHGGHDLQLVLLGIGGPADFAQSRLLAFSRVWESATPFVATRHAKANRRGEPTLDAEGEWVGSPAHDLKRLLLAGGLPAPREIARLEAIQTGGRRLRCLQFQTARQNGNGLRSQVAGAAFRVTFAEPVAGPIAAGYGSHFGLGLFVPVPEAG